ncbi:MAG: 2-dehydro-3-deoxygluconokinase [Pseudomonadota bacterium]|jgi:2-dehydro-3-deoxygluconokinase
MVQETHSPVAEAWCASGPRQWDVVALGEALIEFNQVQAQPPLYLQGFGGDTSNAIIAAARAGARTAYLSRLGDDRWADALLQLWDTEGVDTRGLRRMPGQRTGIYFVHHDEQGHHFSYARAGSAASQMGPDDLQQAWSALIADSHWLHVSGISLAISDHACDTVLAAMRWARRCGTRVALDTNLRLSLWDVERARRVLTEAMGCCDLLLPSLDDLVHLSGQTGVEANLTWCRAHGAAQVVLKNGAQGAVVVGPDQMTVVPGRMTTAVDATGAGDCFCGNLLTRLVHGDTLLQATRWANVAASLSVQGHGAIAPLPHAAQVQALLE